MNDQNVEQEAPDDHRLRQWGADEAVAEADADYVSDPASGGSRLRAIVQRWFPLAAAAIIVALSAALVMSTRRLAQATSGPLKPKPPSAELDRLRMRLTVAETERDAANGMSIAARNERDDARSAVDEQSLKTKDEITRLRGVFESDIRNMMDEAEQTKIRLTGEISRKQAFIEDGIEKLNAEKSRVTKLTGDIAKAGINLAKAKGDIEKLEAKLASETEALRKQYEDAVATGKLSANRAAALEAKRSALPAAGRQLYLATVADDPSGIAPLQAAVERTRLIAQCGRLRGDIRNDATRRLVDTLEVLLTRLKLLDPVNATEAAAFGKLVLTTKATKQIDGILETGDEAPEVLAFLFQAQLVLMGVESEE